MNDTQPVRRSKERLPIQMLKSFRNYNHELIKDTFIKIFFFFDNIKYEPWNKNLHQRLQKISYRVPIDTWRRGTGAPQAARATVVVLFRVNRSIARSQADTFGNPKSWYRRFVINHRFFQSRKFRRSKTHTFISQFDSPSCHEERNQTSSRPIPLSS